MQARYTEPMTVAIAPMPAFDLYNEAPPLAVWPDGSVRVGGTRLLLEHVMEEYLGGKSPEALAERFQSLSLADARAVIAFYHRHREQVDAYLAWVEVEIERIEREMRVAFPQPSRAELLRRMAERDGASPG